MGTASHAYLPRPSCRYHIKVSFFYISYSAGSFFPSLSLASFRSLSAIIALWATRHPEMSILCSGGGTRGTGPTASRTEAPCRLVCVVVVRSLCPILLRLTKLRGSFPSSFPTVSRSAWSSLSILYGFLPAFVNSAQPVMLPGCISFLPVATRGPEVPDADAKKKKEGLCR